VPPLVVVKPSKSGTFGAFGLLGRRRLVFGVSKSCRCTTVSV